MRSRSSKQFYFGPFRLNADAAELWRGDERVEIRPKCFDLLLHLLENPAVVVSKEQLLACVWAGTVVADATLARTVAELREALQDDTDAPRYIETVARRGYKFLAPVDLHGGGSADQLNDYSLVHGADEYPLRPGENLIGRDRDVAIRLFTSQISRHHARIVVDGSSVTVEDLGSTNGTAVNGRKIAEPVTLELGDRITVGNELLVLWSPASDTSPAPSKREGAP